MPLQGYFFAGLRINDLYSGLFLSLPGSLSQWVNLCIRKFVNCFSNLNEFAKKAFQQIQF